MARTNVTLHKQEKLVRQLMAQVYSVADPSEDEAAFDRMAKEQKKLRDMRAAASGARTEAASDSAAAAGDRARLLGPETTDINCKVTLNVSPLPTGIYHLLDPNSSPLLTVEVTNLARHSRRVLVTAYLEGLSARSVKTLELTQEGSTQQFFMHPTLLPTRARRLREVQWATLHVIVDILGNTRYDTTPERQSFSVLRESHNTLPVLCLARTSSINAIVDPRTGELIDMSRYYGAWVTPYVNAVQRQIRLAASLNSAGQIWGYQGSRNSVAPQVEAMFKSLKEAGLTYVNSVLDYGASGGQFIQRTRLPRQSLAQRSANCIDGTVLMASLLEGASLNPAIVLVPGHAFLGWETWEGSGKWTYLETTMIATADFEAACESANKQFRTAQNQYPDDVHRHALADLRAIGIYPME